MVKNFGSVPDWIPGKIAQKPGPLTYRIDVSGGRIWKRHVDHVKRFHAGHAAPDTEPGFDVDIETPPPVADTDRSPTRNEDDIDNSNTPSENTRYPRREHHPPERYDRQNW